MWLKVPSPHKEHKSYYCRCLDAAALGTVNQARPLGAFPKQTETERIVPCPCERTSERGSPASYRSCNPLTQLRTGWAAAGQPGCWQETEPRRERRHQAREGPGVPPAGKILPHSRGARCPRENQPRGNNALSERLCPSLKGCHGGAGSGTGAPLTTCYMSVLGRPRILVTLSHPFLLSLCSAPRSSSTGKPSWAPRCTPEAPAPPQTTPAPVPQPLPGSQPGAAMDGPSRLPHARQGSA